MCVYIYIHTRIYTCLYVYTCIHINPSGSRLNFFFAGYPRLAMLCHASRLAPDISMGNSQVNSGALSWELFLIGGTGTILITGVDYDTITYYNIL